MKKLFALSILLTLLTAAAFAQFKAGVTAEFEGDILRTAAPIDDAKNTTKTDLFTGGTGYEKRYFNFISSMDYWKNSELKFELKYTDPDNKDDPKYGGLLQINADWLWKSLIASDLKIGQTDTDRVLAYQQAANEREQAMYKALLEAIADPASSYYQQTASSVLAAGNFETDFNANYDLDGAYKKILSTKGSGPSLGHIIYSGIGDWNVWGKVGIIKGFVGNTDNRGATADARGAHYNLYMDKFKFEPLGIMKMARPPVGATFSYDYKIDSNGDIVQGTLLAKDAVGFKHNDVDISDLRFGHADISNTYVSVEANLAPITVAIAGDLTGIANSVLAGELSDGIDSHTSIGGAFRVSGDVLDMLKFDAIYKITGGDLITDENQNGFYRLWDPALNGGQGGWVVTTRNVSPQPDGDGHWLNRFGLFGNVNLLNNTLGITAGYSGEFRVDENDRNANSYVSPYYSGIDLRAYFNGIDKLKVSFNNNISFYYIKGVAPQDKTIVQGTMFGLNHSEKTEGYFGMYNALLADYNLTEDLLLSFQVGNRWYSITYTDKSYTLLNKELKANADMDELQLAAGAFYSLTNHVTLGTGLAFNLYHQTYSFTDTTDRKAGLFTFGIPLTVKVVY